MALRLDDRIYFKSAADLSHPKWLHAHLLFMSGCKQCEVHYKATNKRLSIKDSQPEIPRTYNFKTDSDKEGRLPSLLLAYQRFK